ncbi:unnamed protein product [Prorocentrum cordatum]|uniref:Uncharacterized protein n=1 Tax=Prorocentrum cordatum TaxID=2364126 RepID=A0ABN9RKK6_9DINO|nr:unnamed protein product [Polarella glacialis]
MPAIWGVFMIAKDCELNNHLNADCKDYLTMCKKSVQNLAHGAPKAYQYPVLAGTLTQEDGEGANEKVMKQPEIHLATKNIPDSALLCPWLRAHLAHDSTPAKLSTMLRETGATAVDGDTHGSRVAIIDSQKRIGAKFMLGATPPGHHEDVDQGVLAGRSKSRAWRSRAPPGLGARSRAPVLTPTQEAMARSHYRAMIWECDGGRRHSEYVALHV